MDTTFPTGRALRAYVMEAKYEWLRLLRTPAAVVPSLPLAILLYLLIGVMIVGADAAKHPEGPLNMFAAFVVFAATGPGMFGFGIGLAVERQSGVLRLKRAQPVPPGAYLLAKLAMAVVCVALVLSALIPLAVMFGHVPLGGAQIASVVAAGALGMVTFCSIGLFVGSSVSGSAAPGIVNLIYFPMMYLSGMFFPLPKSLAPWALLAPARLSQDFSALVKVTLLTVPILCRPAAFQPWLGGRRSISIASWWRRGEGRASSIRKRVSRCWWA